MTPIPPIPEDRMTDEQLDAELRSFGIDPDSLLDFAFQKACVLAKAQAERIAKLTAANEELEAENTRLEAPVTEEEWGNVYGYSADDEYASREFIDSLIASRATRTPPQEGQYWAIVGFYGNEIIGVCTDKQDVLAEEPRATFIAISKEDFDSFEDWDAQKKAQIKATRTPQADKEEK